MMKKGNSIREIVKNSEAVSGFKYHALSKAEDKLTHEQLRDIEKTRRGLLLKQKNFDPTEIARAIVGTVMPRLLRSRLSWLMIGLYIMGRFLILEKYVIVGENLPNINSAVVSAVGGFMSFFLVFFLSQTYSRFCTQYDLSMRIEGRIFNLCYLARVALPPAEAWRLIRYVNAIHILGYIGLNTAYSDNNLFKALNEKHNILTENEVARLRCIGMDNGGGAYREVIGWAVDVVYDNFRRTHGAQSSPQEQPSIAWDTLPLDEEVKMQLKALYAVNVSSSVSLGYAPQDLAVDINTMQNMVNEILAIRGAIGALYDFADQTIPLPYLHLAVVICFMYLVLITYTIAVFIPVSHYVFPHILGAVLLLINLFFVIGIRELGTQMIDPYGNDLSDLSVIHYIEFTFTASRKILAGYRFSTAGKAMEDELESGRPSCGAPFAEPFQYSLNNIFSDPPLVKAEKGGPTVDISAGKLAVMPNNTMDMRKRLQYTTVAMSSSDSIGTMPQSPNTILNDQQDILIDRYDINTVDRIDLLL
jgi:hypothetical protein